MKPSSTLKNTLSTLAGLKLEIVVLLSVHLSIVKTAANLAAPGH